MLKSGWNLPPGCFESDLPGNRPEDILFEHVCDETCDSCKCVEVCKHIENGSECDCPCIQKAMEAAHEPPSWVENIWWDDD